LADGKRADDKNRIKTASVLQTTIGASRPRVPKGTA
jgi:hypothetical protein